MQTLLQTLQDHDRGHLSAVAELWGLDLPAGDTASAAAHLAERMLLPDSVEEIVESLQPEVMGLLGQILEHEGRILLADLSLQHGLIRRMGPAKRDREKPWRAPQSAVEALWYRGLIATAFADTPSGPREFAFIPMDLRPLLPFSQKPSQQVLGSPSGLPIRTSHTGLACVHDATTLLAALRQSPADDIDQLQSRLPFLSRHLMLPNQWNFLIALLLELGIANPSPIQPVPEPTGAFLEAPIQHGRRQLFQAWLSSDRWNDLAHVPGLRLVGESWPNDPIASRQSLMDFLERTPVDTWWSLDKWVKAVRQWQPSFQRPGADFDSWYIQSESGGEILSGAAHWDQIDGALLRYWISGPLYWLGITELGFLSESGHPDAFRLRFALDDITGPFEQPSGQVSPKPGLQISAQAEIRVSLEGSRVARYQIARIGDWLMLDSGDYVYRLSPRSLETAAAQGVTHKHILSLFEKFAKPPIPPSVLEALNRWGKEGVEARLEKAILLRLKEAALVDELLSHKSTARFLTERLGEKTFKLNPQQASQLIDHAARLGLLIDAEFTTDNSSGQDASPSQDPHRS
jgi:hypothetical protein